MMELQIACRTVTDETGRQRRFHYSLLVEQIETEHFACENYGVRILEENGCASAVPGVTTSATRIDELFTLLVDNCVGPTALNDVVADWI